MTCPKIVERGWPKEITETCYTCRFGTPRDKMTICQNKKSDHYKHCLGLLHPACEAYEKDDLKDGACTDQDRSENSLAE